MFSLPTSPRESPRREGPRNDSLFPPLPLALDNIERLDLSFKDKLPEVSPDLIHFKAKPRHRTLEGVLDKKGSDKPGSFVWAGVETNGPQINFNRKKDLTSRWQEKILSNGLSH